MRIVFLILFEVKYRRNKKLLFKESTKQELLDFEGDNMHKPEKSLLTYKESYRYGSTYKKFTLPVFCSSPAIDLNYKLFEINTIDSYKEAKEKLIEILGDDFFSFLEELNIYLAKSSQIHYDDFYFKDIISIVYTLIKRLDYNCLFLYFIPYLFGHIARDKNSSTLLDKVNKLMRGYLRKDVYIIKLIFKEEQEDNLQIYQKYIVEEDDEVKKEFFTEIFYYQLLFSNLKKKYYFHSSDGKIDFTHPFLPVFFLRYSYLEQAKWLDMFPSQTGSIISNYNMIYPWLVLCY